MQFAPPDARAFRDEEDWCEIAIAMDEASSFSVVWRQGDWPDRHLGRAVVRIGDRIWTTDRDRLTEEQAKGLAASLEELAPAGCLRERRTEEKD
jgi:hypothetical protein